MTHATTNQSPLAALKSLRSQVNTLIPENAGVSNLWTHLGWNQTASDHYLAAQKLGIDIRPLLAPVFSEVVSLVVDGYYMPANYSWEDILHGDIPEFAGETPKKVVLSVIDYAIRQYLDS